MAIANLNLSREAQNPLKQDVGFKLRKVPKRVKGMNLSPELNAAMDDLPLKDREAIARAIEAQTRLGNQNARGFSTAGKESLNPGGRAMFPNQESYFLNLDGVLHPASSRRAKLSEGENTIKIKDRDFERLLEHDKTYDRSGYDLDPTDPNIRPLYHGHNHPSGNSFRSGTANPLSPADAAMFTGLDPTADFFIPETLRTYKRGPVPVGKRLTSRGEERNVMGVPDSYYDDNYNFNQVEGGFDRAQEAGLVGEQDETWQGILDRYSFPGSKRGTTSPAQRSEFRNTMINMYNRNPPEDLLESLLSSNPNTSQAQAQASSLRGEVGALADNLDEGNLLDFYTYAEPEVAEMIREAYEYFMKRGPKGK